VAKIQIPVDLDHVFEALANKHRREIVYVLSLQPCSINQLASMRGLTLPAIHKHIKVLENGNLILRKKIGRTNVLTLNRESMRSLQDWLSQYHVYWGSDDATLQNYAQYVNKDIQPVSKSKVSKKENKK
jgi:DNA-binding transcriptional ArsR family regulator